MAGALYGTDVFAWSAGQADLMVNLARGERVNRPDWDNLIEEIRDVGISQRNAVERSPRLPLVHLLKSGPQRSELPDPCALMRDDLLVDDPDLNAPVARLKAAAPH